MATVFDEPEYDERIVSEIYHENSKQWRSDLAFVERIIASSVDPTLQALMATSQKRYRHGRTHALPRDTAPPRTTLADAILKRRSRSEFGPEPLALAELATLLQLSAGITGRIDGHAHTVHLRASPSAGALYPIELYVNAQNVSGLDPGTYHFAPFPCGLELVGEGDPCERLARLTHTPQLEAAACVLALTGVPARARIKYGERAYRFLLLEAGHIAQNLLLTATALDLASLPIGGFVDAELDDLLGIDGVEEISLYVIAAGHGAAGDRSPHYPGERP
jgi:SagB-type dehydrogenase family enzyme